MVVAPACWFYFHQTTIAPGHSRNEAFSMASLLTPHCMACLLLFFASAVVNDIQQAALI